jgi:hypothetical protein
MAWMEPRSSKETTKNDAPNDAALATASTTFGETSLSLRVAGDPQNDSNDFIGDDSNPGRHDV